MPGPTNILEGLRFAANQAIVVAIGWHVITLLALVALALRWRPSRANAGALLAAPVASASAVAFTHGSPFNGGLLGALAVLLLALAPRLGSFRATCGGPSTTVIGAAMLAIGWTYPHFLESRPPVTYLFAAPMGVIPCPTLSLVIGFALIGGGVGSRAWSLAVSLVGMFYGVFGVARLGVRLDLALVAGAAALLITALRVPTRRSHEHEKDLSEPCRKHIADIQTRVRGMHEACWDDVSRLREGVRPQTPKK